MLHLFFIRILEWLFDRNLCKLNARYTFKILYRCLILHNHFSEWEPVKVTGKTSSKYILNAAELFYAFSNIIDKGAETQILVS